MSNEITKADEQYATYCRRYLEFLERDEVSKYIDVIAAEACAYAKYAGSPINVRLEADEDFQRKVREARRLASMRAREARYIADLGRRTTDAGMQQWEPA